jgi:hypothetical protein
LFVISHGQHPVQRLGIKLRPLAEGDWPLQNPPLHPVGDSLGEEQKCLEDLGQLGSPRTRSLPIAYDKHSRNARPLEVEAPSATR